MPVYLALEILKAPSSFSGFRFVVCGIRLYWATEPLRTVMRDMYGENREGGEEVTSAALAVLAALLAAGWPRGALVEAATVPGAILTAYRALP